MCVLVCCISSVLLCWRVAVACCIAGVLCAEVLGLPEANMCWGVLVCWFAHVLCCAVQVGVLWCVGWCS
jgi:hypothetical protein